MARFPLRAKLALIALVLLVLPWAGWLYVRELERFLLVAQADVDDREVRQAAAQRIQRFAPRGIGRDLVAVALQRLGVVRANGGVIFDDRDAAGHAATIPEGAC